MNNTTQQILSPEESTSRIFELSGAKFEPDIATDLWPKIMKHKWLLSEKLSRDVGFRIACIDFLENMEQALAEYMTYKRTDILNELGAQTISREMWDSISESQPPKQLVQRRIILPLTEEGLSKKHGVIPPKAITFFGPPGTGKTHFAKAIAGVLSWWYIEIVPSMLMVDGVEKIGANLRDVMEKARHLDEVVLFIDEFDEIAGSRDTADRCSSIKETRFCWCAPRITSGNWMAPCSAREDLTASFPLADWTGKAGRPFSSIICPSSTPDTSIWNRLST
jgi:transitional endoplasmic reticulum ATPase